MTIVPIWKDTYVEISSAEQFTEYYITIQYFGYEEKVIYNGRAFGYRPTGSTYNYTAEIFLNPIVKDYLFTKVEDPALETPMSSRYSQAIVRVYNSTNDTIIGEEYVFIDDYSYNEDFYYDRGVICLNRPVKKNVASIPLPFTTFDLTLDDENYNCTWTFISGMVVNYISSSTTKYKDTILYNPRGEGICSCTWEGEDMVKEKILSYTVDDCKSNYAYYYKNAVGGYDVLCVSGKMVQVDNLERKTIEVYKDGKQNFENVITRTYSTFTGYLTEEQSLLMHHLLNSTEVYLYDIQEGTYVPVVLTNTTTEYKTKQNQNKKMISYNITCEEATKKYRR
jgi:hypothetical protein